VRSARPCAQSLLETLDPAARLDLDVTRAWGYSGVHGRRHLVTTDPPELPSEEDDPAAIVGVTITDELDLHTFAPRDARELVGDYLDECVERGLPEVRIIHGKGTGTLRRIVHAVLKDHPAVLSFHLGDSFQGGWGATVARLKPK
jgi:dsDNA-specific endonuclease/ATPase MutS2